jgi:hypothetical protein
VAGIPGRRRRSRPRRTVDDHGDRHRRAAVIRLLLGPGERARRRGGPPRGQPCGAVERKQAAPHHRPRWRATTRRVGDGSRHGEHFTTRPERLAGSSRSCEEASRARRAAISCACIRRSSRTAGSTLRCRGDRGAPCRSARCRRGGRPSPAVGRNVLRRHRALWRREASGATTAREHRSAAIGWSSTSVTTDAAEPARAGTGLHGLAERARPRWLVDRHEASRWADLRVGGRRAHSDRRGLHYPSRRAHPVVWRRRGRHRRGR